MARTEHNISIFDQMEEIIRITLNEPIILSSKDKMRADIFREMYEKRFWLLIYFFMKTYQEDIKIVPSWRKTKRTYLCHFLVITEKEKDINNTLERIFNEQEYLVMLNKTVLCLETLLRKKGLSIINRSTETISCLEFTDLYEYIFERRKYKSSYVIDIGTKVSTYVTKDIKPIYYITSRDIEEIERKIDLPKEIDITKFGNITEPPSKILEKDKDFLIKEIEKRESKKVYLPLERGESIYVLRKIRSINNLRKEESKRYQEDMFWSLIYLLVSEEGLTIELEAAKRKVRPRGIRNILEIEGKQIPENLLTIISESRKSFIDKRRSIIVLQLMEIIKNCGWYIELGVDRGQKAQYKRRHIKYLQKGRIILNKQCIEIISEIINDHKEEFRISYKYIITPLLIRNIKEEIDEKLKGIEIDLDILRSIQEREENMDDTTTIEDDRLREDDDDKTIDKDDDSSSTVIETFI